MREDRGFTRRVLFVSGEIHSRERGGMFAWKQSWRLGPLAYEEELEAMLTFGNPTYGPLGGEVFPLARGFLVI